MKRWKRKTIIIKLQKSRRKISLLNEEKRNNESNMKDKINPNQVDNEYSL